MKALEELYTDISNSINRGNIDKLKSLLLRSDQIDVTQDGCDFFYFPIERDQPELVSVLMGYFFQKQLPRFEKDNATHSILLKNLRERLIDWTEEYGCSKEMQKVVESYGLNISGDDAISVRSEENVSSIQNGIEKVDRRDSQEHLSANNIPDKEEAEFIINRKYEETSDWELNQLKSGLMVNKHEDPSLSIIGNDSTDHHSG